MLTKLPAKAKIAAFDIDAQNTFTPICPDELPVAEGDQIVSELNAQAALAALRIGSRDAHSPQAVWIADSKHPVLSPVSGYPDVDVRGRLHGREQGSALLRRHAPRGRQAEGDRARKGRKRVRDYQRRP